MYLKSLRVESLKCFSRLELDFPHRGDDYSGWVVLLGDNGAGKTTLLQAMGLCLVGGVAGQRLLVRPTGWVRSGASFARVDVELLRGEADTLKRKRPQRTFKTSFAITGIEEATFEDGATYYEPQIVHLKNGRSALSASL